MDDRALRSECEARLIKAGCSRKVIAHCNAVCDTALSLAGDSLVIDRELLIRGAMLHDIGRSVTHSLGHAQAGADLLREAGDPEELARIVERHTGAGLTADECTLLGLAPRNCMPETPVEKLVTNADNLVKGHHRITIEENLADVFYLPRKARKRMYRLFGDVHLLCD